MYKGPSIKDRSDGGVKLKVGDGGGGRLHTGRPQKRKKLVFRIPYWSPTPPPDVFGRGVVFQTDDVGQGGGCPKSHFLLVRL